MSKRMLVTYFSASGTTRAVAERLAHAIGADIKEIVPAQKYTAADLNWRDAAPIQRGARAPRHAPGTGLAG